VLISNIDATTDIAIWSQTEQGLAITAGSLVTLQPLLSITLRRLGFSNVGSGNRAAPSDGIRTFGQGSGKSGSSHKTSRSLFSISTFTKMDEEDEEAPNRAGADDKDIELGPRGGTQMSLRTDPIDYRVSIQAMRPGQKRTAPIARSESQEDLQGITRKTSYRVIL
jgi:hypothetical protein